MQNRFPVRCVPTSKAVGLTLCHDITEIVPGASKGPAFLRGHIVREQDIEHFLRLGKEHLYVWELPPTPHDASPVHEDEAAVRMAQAFAGPGIVYGSPREGRINFRATHQGLFCVDLDLLERVNSVRHVTLATAHSLQGVKEGRTLAGTRVIPLFVPESTVRAVEEHCGTTATRLLTVLPYKTHKVAIVTTGGEVFHGRIQDRFGPVLHEKFTAWGSTIHSQEIVPDDVEITANAIGAALASGAGMVCVTGGMSVDPDDKTPAAIRAAGGETVAYGAPVFPGAMFMLAYRGHIPLLGLPGCIMYHRASIFDLIVPRILAGLRIQARDITQLAHGGLCENCPECHYPACAFGKN